MKKSPLIVLSLGALTFAINAHALTFSNGTIVVQRIGDGSTVLTNGGNVTYLDEYYTNGTLRQSILCPTNWTYSGFVTNWPICNRGSCTASEGMLHRTVDGQYLLLAGYGTNGAALPLSVSIDTLNGRAVPRIIARCDWNGDFDTTTALTNWASGSGNFPRGAASVEGKTLWLAAQGTAVRTCVLGAPTRRATTINGATSDVFPTPNAVTNPVNQVRDVAIYDYNLYAAIGGSTDLGFSKVGRPTDTGLPTGGDKTWTNLPGVSTSTTYSPHQFVLLNVTNSVPGVNVLYVTDDSTSGSGGIWKYCLTNGVWGNFGQLSDPGSGFDSAGQRIDGLAGATDGSGNVVLYFTANSSCNGSALFKIVDTNGVAAAGVGPFTSLAVLSGSPANAVWKGVAFSPSSNTAPPSAGFAADPATGWAPMFVTFYFTNTVGSITNVFWDFGDTNSPNYLRDESSTNIAAVANATHIYGPGTYTVTNIVSGPLGYSTNVAVNYIVVTNPPAPAAYFTYWISNSVAPNATVVFTNLSAFANTNAFWTFGDGSVSNITPGIPALSNSLSTVRYTYPYAGTYTATLIVRNYSGQDDTQAVNYITVTGGLPPGPPVATFAVSTNMGVAPLAVTFFDNSTGYITNRFWDFGDSSSTNITVPTSGSFSHTYASSGIYPATLIAYGPGGSGTNSLSITVSGTQPPFAAWQSYYFPGGGPNAGGNADPDGDGMINSNEFLTGFNPTNSAAYLHVISVAKSGSDMKVTYLGANGDGVVAPGPKTNILEFAIGTANGSYSNNFVSTGQTNELTGGTGLGTITNMVDSGGATNIPSRYYRVRVLVP